MVLSPQLVNQMLALTDTSVVLVIGPPGSGKAQLADTLGESSGLPVYSTDRFVGTTGLIAISTVIEVAEDKGFIVEGPVCYRWLRKRKQLKLRPPDIVISLTATDEEIEEAASSHSRYCDVQRIKAFHIAHERFLDNYLMLDQDKPTIWVHGDSNHLRSLIEGGPSGTSNRD